MALLKLLSSNEIVAQVIAFLILLWLMKRFAWKPILKILDDRHDRIASEFKSIDSMKADADRMRADYESRIASIEDEAKARIARASDEARRQADEIRQAARAEGEQILVKAKESIRQEITKAEENLKDTIVNLTVDIAGKVVQEKLTAEDDKKIVESFLTQMEKK